MRISDWSSDVCSSDLTVFGDRQPGAIGALYRFQQSTADGGEVQATEIQGRALGIGQVDMAPGVIGEQTAHDLRRSGDQHPVGRSEERRVGQECVSTCRSRWAPYQ